MTSPAVSGVADKEFSRKFWCEVLGGVETAVVEEEDEDEANIDMEGNKDNEENAAAIDFDFTVGAIAENSSAIWGKSVKI